MILIVLLFLILFYLSTKIGQRLSSKFFLIASLGDKIFFSKLKSFSIFKNYVESNSSKINYRVFSIIFLVILLKSIVFYFISLLLITPIVLLAQGIMMGSLFAFYNINEMNVSQMKIVTYFQLIGHIIAGSYGFLKGLDWFEIYNINHNHYTIVNHEIIIYLFIIIAALVAAYLETKSLVNSRYLNKFIQE